MLKPPGADDAIATAVYEYVDRNGTVTVDELAREISVDRGQPQSKPARSGPYSQEASIAPSRLRDVLDRLEAAGHLDVVGDRVRVSVGATGVTIDVDGAPVRLRPARERDRETLLETMRAVGREGLYVVAGDVADRIGDAHPLVRLDADRPRVFFVAVREPPADEEAAGGASESAHDVLGWLHLEEPALASLAHTAELTVGVHPDHRRNGIASQLLDYAANWAGEVGYRKLCQSVPATNTDAIAFLESTGWVREGVREGQIRIDDAFVDEVLFSLWPAAE